MNEKKLLCLHRVISYICGGITMGIGGKLISKSLFWGIFFLLVGILIIVFPHIWKKKVVEK